MQKHPHRGAGRAPVPLALAVRIAFGCAVAAGLPAAAQSTNSADNNAASSESSSAASSAPGSVFDVAPGRLSGLSAAVRS